MRNKNKGNKIKVPPRLLDKISTSFDCSGSFELKQPISIFYSSQEQHGIIKFPKPKEEEIQKAIKLAKKSGFGKGDKNVIDEEYRLAFQYLPKDLGLSSILTQTITQGITQAVSFNLGSKQLVQAELIKLNIYPKGGLFHHHVDSPKGTAFGSLVVFLPCYFEGGDLIIQHNKDKHNFSFGSGSKESVYINWVAFYNDCVHEITEVLSGYRLTLSYNLFYMDSPKVQIFPSEVMVQALSSLQNKKTYGYYCQHYYGNNALKKAKEGRRLLKGKDYELYNSAKAIGIQQVQIRVLYKIEETNPQDGNSIVKIFIGPPQKISKVKMGCIFHQEFENQASHWIVKECEGRQFDLDEVTWLNTPKDDTKYTYAINGYYGNDYSLNESYCELIILLST